MVACGARHRDGERSPWPRRRRAPTIMDMSTERPDTTTTSTEPTAPTEAERAAAKREERQGWVMLTGIFVGGGVLVAIAALVT
jgi:hypothetical protein